MITHNYSGNSMGTLLNKNPGGHFGGQLFSELHFSLRYMIYGTILYNTGGCPPPCVCVCVCVGHKICIQLALPISPEIMDRF